MPSSISLATTLLAAAGGKGGGGKGGSGGGGGISGLDPGNGTQPPGTESLTTILSWLAWGVAFACVAGVLITAATMALHSRRGEGGEHASRLGLVLVACVLGGSAASLVGALV